MSPIRHEGDFRQREISSWDEYVEDQLTEMTERGEFEDLPQRGKPIKIWKTDVNPANDLAFSRLKNAGYRPTWMDLDHEITGTISELEAYLDTAASEIAALIDQLRNRQREKVVEPALSAETSLWARWRAWFRLDLSENETPVEISVGGIMLERERRRRAFLERAKSLDARIVLFHDALPRELANLQRFRWLPERSEAMFDERVPLAWLTEG